MMNEEKGKTTNDIQFASEGFDLDDLKKTSADPNNDETHGEGYDNAILEIGGGVTRISTASANDNNKGNTKEEDEEEISKSESLKQQGNNMFRLQNWLDAYDYYTEAIEACPSNDDNLTGLDILKQKQEWENEQHRQALDEYKKRDEQERLAKKHDNNNDSNTTTASAAPLEQQQEESPKKLSFQVPHHPYGEKYLSVYHCNRAACSLHLQRYTEAIDDCTIAILLKPTYVKAYMRRCLAYEQTEQYTEALEDVTSAYQLDPSNAQIQKEKRRIQKVNDDHLEELKQKTMGQLKDLGNSILGNFGLSLDNFKTKQDPKTGSYSISFDQGK